MSRIEEAEKLLSRMTREEKTAFLERVMRDLGGPFPGIDRTPGVCGGDARIIRTRIPVWVLERARRLGASETDLLRAYPTLRADDLANAWLYVHAQPDEIDQQIRENEAA